ncbi:metal-dependent hydrolase [Candidatus Woesearchaeota archaeon]|nr:metal-dependent hydrolase [Candidatus Woesearchaeota archaeon]
MPYAVTHVLLTIIVIDLYRDYIAKKGSISLHTVLIGGIAGLLPDIDILADWILSFFGYGVMHGTITHTPWFALLFLIPGLVFQHRREKKKAMLYYVISFGVFFHLFLDWFLGGGYHLGVMWLYPFSFWTHKIHLLNMFGWNHVPAALDALILILWLWHEEVKHKIKDFI